MKNQHEPFVPSKSSPVTSLLHPTKHPKSKLIMEAGVGVQNTLLDSNEHAELAKIRAFGLLNEVRELH